MTSTDMSATTPSSLLPICSSVLDAWRQQPDQSALRDETLQAARNAAKAIAALPKAKREGDDVQAALSLVRLFGKSGLQDRGTSEADQSLAANYRAQGWPGALASMVLTPAWSSSPSLSYDDVPLWLWTDLTQYLFAAPANPWASNLADAYAAQMKRSLEMLMKLCDANRGSTAVRSALGAFLEISAADTLALSSSNLAECLTLRGKLLSHAFALGPQNDALTMPREGRALKLGVCLPRLSDTPDVHAVLAFVQHLPVVRFEVQFFVLEYTYGKIEERLRAASANISLLDSITPHQSMQMACLDAALLIIDPLEAPTPITRLGACRFAPLQIATNLQSIPTGLPEVDLFLSVDEKAAVPKLDRLGLLPLSAQVCHLDDAPEQPVGTYSREALGIADSAKVLATFVHHRRISSAMLDVWTAILSSEPESTLLLHPFTEGVHSDEEIQSLCKNIDLELASRGIAANRIAILGARLASYEDWVAVMKLADVYLDSHPCSYAPAIAAAFDAAVPVVCWTGEQARSRAGALMLETEKLGHYVAATAPECVTLACRLLRDSAERQITQEVLREAMAAGMDIHDSLAVSDSFAALVESAFDQIILVGNRAFKQDETTFRITLLQDPDMVLSEARNLFESSFNGDALNRLEQVLSVQPTRVDVRRLMGQVLSKMEYHRRASEYQLAVMQKTPEDAGIWFELGYSFSNSGKMQDALTVLETSLRLDDKQVEAWFFLGELALKTSNASFAREVAEVLRKLAPDDYRLNSLEDRISSIEASS